MMVTLKISSLHKTFYIYENKSARTVQVCCSFSLSLLTHEWFRVLSPSCNSSPWHVQVAACSTPVCATQPACPIRVPWRFSNSPPGAAQCSCFTRTHLWSWFNNEDVQVTCWSYSYTRFKTFKCMKNIFTHFLQIILLSSHKKTPIFFFKQALEML